MKQTKLTKKKLFKIFLRAEKKLQKIKVFRKNCKGIIAFSGGQDSISLSLFLRSLKRKWHLNFDVVYCHHSWQQENFYTIVQITKYASYIETGSFVFLYSKF